MIIINKIRPIRFKIKRLIIILLPEPRNDYNHTSGGQPGVKAQGLPLRCNEVLVNTVRSRYKRQLIQLNMNKSGLHGLEWKTRDPNSLVNDQNRSCELCGKPIRTHEGIREAILHC